MLNSHNSATEMEVGVQRKIDVRPEIKVQKINYLIIHFQLVYEKVCL